MKHKIMPILLCLLLCMALMPTAAFADSAKTTPVAPPGIWTDHAAADFAGGSGTKDDPYQIATPEQLAKLAKDINSGDSDKKHSGEYFKLTSDLDLSAHRWIPIGSGDLSLGHYNFCGYFDGNGKTITGLYVDESQPGFCVGLFGIVYGYEIKNLTVKDAYIKKEGDKSYGKTGILIGAAWQDTDRMINIKDCSVSGTVESKGDYTGGLVGYNHGGVYENCTADVKVTGSNSTGGFVGQDGRGTYKNCTALGDVSGTEIVGGFAGYLINDSMLAHCAAFGKVTANGKIAGGFVGRIQDFATISHCAAFGDVESTVEGVEPQAGGFAGFVQNSTISSSHAAGAITVASSQYKAGGFAGGAAVWARGAIESSSFDIEKNAGLDAVCGEFNGEAVDVEGISTQAVKDKICKDYYNGHVTKKVAEKPATCTEDGQKAYWECENCGRLFADEKGTQQIEKLEVIPATGHKFSDWKVIKEATAAEKGEKQRICQVCQFVEKAEIPAIGTTGATDPAKDTKDNGEKSAATGDTSSAALYGVFALLAAAGAAGALWIRRKTRL